MYRMIFQVKRAITLFNTQHGLQTTFHCTMYTLYKLDNNMFLRLDANFTSYRNDISGKKGQNYRHGLYSKYFLLHAIYKLDNSMFLRLQCIFTSYRNDISGFICTSARHGLYSKYFLQWGPSLIRTLAKYMCIHFEFSR